MRIPRSLTYAQFLKKIYQKIGVDSNEYLLKVSAKHSCQYLGRIKETLFPISNDDSLSFLLDPAAEIPMLELYVDAEQIHVEPPPPMSQQWGDINPQMSNQWGEYMNLLATPGLPPCSNTDYLAEPTQSHTPLSENFIPNENDGEDPTADSFVNDSDEASEPDEAEYPIPPEDGPDRVDINVMAETFAQRGAETSSEPTLPDLNTQPTFYRSIQFFQQTFPEIPADSVDVPNLRHVKCNPSYGIKHVIQNVKDQTGYDVPYQKAWYSLKMAREIVYGTWESSVQKLPAYLGAIQKYNPGTIVEWKHKGLQASTGKYVMGYVFWAFKPCIDGFQFCRNVISVDGTHLYTKYKYKLLIAAAMDGNQQVLPLAFAVVDEETYPSWKWFLQQLSRHVIRGRRGMCLISDRHAGLIKAVREGPDFVSPHGVHRYCLRHVCSNFNNTIKNVVLKDLCWQAGSEYQLRKFNRIMDEIKKQDVKAFAYLDAINKEKWTASHDGGWRCGILTTNMSECINGVLKGARRLPVSALVEITLERTVHYFHVRAMKGQKMLQNNQLWTDFACKMFISWQQKAVEHTVTKYSHAQQSASVVTRRQGRHGMNTHVVKIANRECSCGKWNQFGIPCSHAQKVCGAYNISAASMVKDYYDVMAYNNTYSKHFEPVQSEDYWDDPNFQLVHDPTIRTVTRPGRNQTTRIHNEMDWRQTRARQEAQQQQGDSSIQENVP
ncbi:hypothetical protein Sango_0338300 [Sesamum angolense]|uniref:SWIM-type domain-containing protein n=3 Tax=Sesamum TaxID=4181 RepID=A0AAE1X975_9LAMI|nr:hypothetical protein Sango_0338300 [Sesamum angolense]